MAYENIEITNSNFCLTPQIGTIGTIDTTNPTTVLRVKNTAGGLISDYALSSNIINDVVSVEYVGPINLDGFIDDVEFFTLESIPTLDGFGNPTGGSSKCIIKRWELDVSSSLLNLKQQIVKYTTGNYYYDASGMAVEHYHREFLTSHQGGINYLDIDSSDKIESGSKLFLGPSTDGDNEDATETVIVSHVTGDRVYLNGNTKYQYVSGDPITFYNNIYLISKLGYGGDVTKGTIFKLSAYTGSLKEYGNKGEYKNIVAARWSTISSAVAVVNSTQLLFIRPYDSYLNWRSMSLNNLEDDAQTTVIPVHDIVFDNYKIYKLMNKATYYTDDLGNKQTYFWTMYNHQEDSLLPYTNSSVIYTKKAQLNGYNQYTDLNIQVRDQFNVGLRDVNVKTYKAGGDPGCLFTPLNGQAITDIDGKAVIGYTSGVDYTGLTEVTLRADKGSPYTQSEYVWDMIRLISNVEIVRHCILLQREKQEDYTWFRQIYDPYKNTHYKRIVSDGSSQLEITEPRIYLICYSYFSNEGGNWCEGTLHAFQPEYWPLYVIPGVQRTDAINSDGGGTWSWFPGEPPFPPGHIYEKLPRPNILLQVVDFTQKRYKYVTGIKALKIKQPKYCWIYDRKEIGANKYIEDGLPPDTLIVTISGSSDLNFSQLKLSKHTHIVDDQPYDELFTNVRLNQFVFVSDAIPAFWSYKNQKETYIWVRLRPFAFNLDGDTLKFYVRELWTEKDVHYDTGYYEVTHLGTITYFDAGGGLLGIEFMYQPSQIFHHNASVYVHIEIYDTAAERNFISIDYWFRIIPDYNAPYLINMDPDREEDYVPIDKEIYFEIKDDGAGIDIDTLEVFINSRMVVPTDIVKASDYHYKITCDLSYDLQFNKKYTVGVRVSDVSESRNRLRDSYRFFTAESGEPWFTGFDPRLCKRGMPRFTDVSFVVLGTGQGVDEETIRIQVHDQDVTDKSNILPIIYRIS